MYVWETHSTNRSAKMQVVILTIGVESGHSQSREVEELGTVQPFCGQLLAVPKWACRNPEGNSTARGSPTIAPKGFVRRLPGVLFGT